MGVKQRLESAGGLKQALDRFGHGQLNAAAAIQAAIDLGGVDNHASEGIKQAHVWPTGCAPERIKPIGKCQAWQGKDRFAQGYGGAPMKQGLSDGGAVDGDQTLGVIQ